MDVDAVTALPFLSDFTNYDPRIPPIAPHPLFLVNNQEKSNNVQINLDSLPSKPGEKMLYPFSNSSLQEIISSVRSLDGIQSTISTPSSVNSSSLRSLLPNIQAPSFHLLLGGIISIAAHRVSTCSTSISNQQEFEHHMLVKETVILEKKEMG